MKSKTAIMIVILVVLLITLITTLGKSFGSKDKSTIEYFLEAVIATLIIISCVLIGMKFIYNIDISTYFKQKGNSNEIDIVLNQTTPPNDNNNDDDNNEHVPPEIMIGDQVFNIPSNSYTYTDAVALCKAYGSKLANYKQIEDAYKKGGEWCNYGWSDDQMALFPTQQSTWDKLQNIKGHENDCGRPGINGGYIANPNIRFGVNCYGHKPEITGDEQDQLSKGFNPPLTKQDKQINQKVHEFKQYLDTIAVSPFNYNTWSKVF
tara:strand:+ start:3414 stop:4202 length:789 start_codon:yes stop_codon:yes gene_type:complete